MSPLTHAAFRVVEEDVSHERLDGEVIAINLKTGHYYSMSGSAADVWFLIASNIAIKNWAQTLGKSFGTSVPESEFEAFVKACLEAGLIAPTNIAKDEVSELPADYKRTKWVAPQLEEFDDMRDLILVDPIHDTTRLGWPHTKE